MRRRDDYYAERARQSIRRAIEESIEAGMSVDDFRKEAASIWQEVLDEMKHMAGLSWEADR